MSAAIIRRSRRALHNARLCAREGNAWFARLWLDEAGSLYPVSYRQRQAIQKELLKFQNQQTA